MTDEVLNTLVVLGHRLLLVEVGGGFETHLCEATSDSAARAALEIRRALPNSLADALERGGEDDRLDALLDRLLDTAWKPTTLCGRAWDEMAAGEAGGSSGSRTRVVYTRVGGHGPPRGGPSSSPSGI